MPNFMIVRLQTSEIKRGHINLYSHKSLTCIIYIYSIHRHMRIIKMNYKTGIGYMYYNSGVKNVIMDLRILKWIVISEFNRKLNEMTIINKPI